MSKSHTHLQFAPANATPIIAKEYVLAKAQLELNKKHLKTKLNEKALLTTMYIKNSFIK